MTTAIAAHIDPSSVTDAINRQSAAIPIAFTTSRVAQ
jgi:hypothetical protein